MLLRVCEFLLGARLWCSVLMGVRLQWQTLICDNLVNSLRFNVVSEV